MKVGVQDEKNLIQEKIQEGSIGERCKQQPNAKSRLLFAELRNKERCYLDVPLFLKLLKVL